MSDWIRVSDPDEFRRRLGAAAAKVTKLVERMLTEDELRMIAVEIAQGMAREEAEEAARRLPPAITLH